MTDQYVEEKMFFSSVFYLKEESKDKRLTEKEWDMTYLAMGFLDGWCSTCCSDARTLTGTCSSAVTPRQACRTVHPLSAFYTSSAFTALFIPSPFLSLSLFPPVPPPPPPPRPPTFLFVAVKTH